MEEIRVTCDTLRVTFSFCCFMKLSIREKIRLHVDIEDRTKEKEFSFACKKKLKVYYHIYLQIFISVTHCESLVTLRVICDTLQAICDTLRVTCDTLRVIFLVLLLYMQRKIPFLSFYLLYSHENEFSLV